MSLTVGQEFWAIDPAKISTPNLPYAAAIRLKVVGLSDDTIGRRIDSLTIQAGYFGAVGTTHRIYEKYWALCALL